MRLSGLCVAAVLLLSSFTLAQHSSSSSSSSAGSSSSGGGSHSSSSGGSSYSGGSSGGGHSSAGSSSGGGSSHSAGGGGSHSSAGGGGGHSVGGSHVASGDHGFGGHNGGAGRGSAAGTASTPSPAHGTSLRGGEIVTPKPPRHGIDSVLTRPTREPRPVIPGRTAVPERRGFFSFFRHPFRKHEPRPAPPSAAYLPRPICPKGHCALPCPIGQVRNGGVCSPAPIPACVPGQIWNGINCGQYADNRCFAGGVWNGISCGYRVRFLGNCDGALAALRQQEKRVRDAASRRMGTCAAGPSQECSDATATWQSEENLRRTLLSSYQQCQTHSRAAVGYGLHPYDATPWFDSLSFGYEGDR